MAHPLVYPGKYFFYPIGNTSAVSMTRDLAPEEPADILLLGCGDPRNVLYTVFCEPPNARRTLDVTCNDIDPSVLARNVILFTMLSDRVPHKTTLWNVFFHWRIDAQSHSILKDHCQQLVGLSDSLSTWSSSKYGHFIKMCSEYTLAELRRHWTLYANMHDLPSNRLAAITEAFGQQSERMSQKDQIIISGARSAGPLLFDACRVISEQFRNYWRTGTTFTKAKQSKSASMLNPTFAYSLAGEGCSVHYGLDPLAPFHLASLFGNTMGSVTVDDAVEACRSQFDSWCSAFSDRIFSKTGHIPVVRFLLGEATAVCRTLRGLSTAGALSSGIPVMQWRTQLLSLSHDDYVSQLAPHTFNVIDSSNLDDHLGLINVLITAIPLFGEHSDPVLYMESLLFRGLDATKEFAAKLYADISSFALLVGFCPMDYLAGFSSRCNTHEIMGYQVIKSEKKQFHQATTWKRPISGDAVACEGSRLPPVFDPRQLGTLLFDMYHDMFESEDAMHYYRLNQNNMPNAIAQSNILHDTREGFVLLLKLVKDTLRLSTERWTEVMVRFFDLEDADTSNPMDRNNYQDFCAHLYRHGVYTIPGFYAERVPNVGRFTHWPSIPPVVRIVFEVPREKLAVLEESGTPLLQCDVRGTVCHNIFTSVHAAFGSAIEMGTKAQPRVMFTEDLDGWKGNSPLVVSFTVSSWLLTNIEPPENLFVCLSVRSTMGTAPLVQKLGLYMNLHTAKLMDESVVHILPEHPLPQRKGSIWSHRAQTTRRIANAEIGPVDPVQVKLDEECELVLNFTCRFSVENEDAKKLFTSGVTPHLIQVSPCVMRAMLDGFKQDVVYPFPVIGGQHTLRLARKSLYVEVVAPIFGPFKPDGMRVNHFPVVGASDALKAWSIHRVDLGRLPAVNVGAVKKQLWFSSHVGSMMSARERSLRKKHQHGEDGLMAVKDTIHTIFMRYSGAQGGTKSSVFALRDKQTNNCDTIIFISSSKYDLQSHTVVCDAYVVPLTPELLRRIEQPFGKLVHQGNMENVIVYEGEMKVWKQLLPALAERCRVTWSHGKNCEYDAQGQIPLTTDMEKNPICSCGRGKDVAGMSKVVLWSKLAPYATRIALSPLFAVSYLETIGRDIASRRCYVCRGKGKPKMQLCTGCKKVRYCSQKCQKKDWKAHKPECKA